MKIMMTLSLSLLASVLLASCGSDQPAGMPPSITSVSWTHTANCTASTASDVTITVVAADPDDAAGDLSYTGTVSGCGNITAASGTISCPQLAPYNGSVTVTDPDNLSDSQGFTIEVCINGSAP